MVNPLSKELLVSKFNTGLNVVDSSLDIQDSDLTIADNVEYLAVGEVKSIDAPTPIGNHGYISVFADAGGGKVTVTSTDHGLSNGDNVTIEWTTSYDGNYVVSSVATDTFEITDTFVANDATGRYRKRIIVNSEVSTKFLGIVKFNSLVYAMVSNYTVARLMKSTGDTDATGDWTEANSTDFDKDAITRFDVYGEKLWFVNGKSLSISKSITVFTDATGGQVTVTSVGHGLIEGNYITISGTTSYNGSFNISNVTTDTFEITDTWVANDATGTIAMTQTLNILDTSDVLTGFSSNKLPVGINHITTHLERQTVSFKNTFLLSIQYPDGLETDWDNSTVYTGADTAGFIQLDNNTEDEIVGLETLYSQLVLFRKRSIHIMTGTEILTSTITKKTMSKNGVLAPLSIARGDNTVYFLGGEGVKSLNTITVQGQTEELDSLTTLTIDRPIKTYIDAISRSGKQNMSAYAFKDKYYLSDITSGIIFVLDEIATARNPNGQPVWSRWNNHDAEVFVEFNDKLICAGGSCAYYMNDDENGDVDSKIKTKGYNGGDNIFVKIYESILFMFRTFAKEQAYTIKWYLDGASNTFNATIGSSNNKYNTELKYNNGAKYNEFGINFKEYKKRKLMSGKNIAFSVEASGKNRFQLSSFDLIFEQTRRGG